MTDETQSKPTTSQDGPGSLKEIWQSTGKTVDASYREPRKKKRWGIPDVIWGFVLMLVAQLLIGVVISFVIVAQAFNNGITDPDKLTDYALSQATTNGPLLIASAFSMYAAWIIVMLIATFKRGQRSFAKDFWIRFKWTDILWGLGVGITLRALDLGFSWFLSDVLHVDTSKMGNTDPIISQTGITFFILAIVIGCICAPLFEEMFIRGMFLQALLRNFRKNNALPTSVLGRVVYDQAPGVWKFHKKVKRGIFKIRYFLAALITAIVFGCMHFQGKGDWTDLVIICQTGVVGFIFAFLVYRTRRVGTSIASHIVFNTSGIILAVMLGAS